MAERLQAQMEEDRPKFERIARHLAETQGEAVAEDFLEILDESREFVEGLKEDAALREESIDRMQWRTSSSLVLMAGMGFTDADGCYIPDIAKAELDGRNTEALIQHSELTAVHNEAMRKSTDASHWLAFAVLSVALVQVVLLVWQITS